MFNFTTQTVYNEIKTTAGAGRNVWLSDGAKPALRIGNTRFDAANIECIQVKLPTKESLASVTFDMADAIPSEGSTTGRIVLYVGLSMNSQDSFYANDYVYKGKPLFIEFPVSSTDSPDVVATRVKKIAAKYLLFSMGSEKILDVTADTTAADADTNVDAKGTVTFTGVNGYQQIKKAVLQLWNPEAVTVDCCTTSGTYEDKVIGVPVVYTTSADGTVTTTETKVDADGNVVGLASNEVAIAPGLEAFGDYNWIIHNLRLPTLANTNFWAPTKKMGEMPVPGQVYTQFIITIKKERDGIMGEIVGARGTSVTTHVLYVAGAAALNPSTTTTAADKVYKELNTLASAKIVKSGSDGAADTVLQEPFAPLTD
jgi:hypothetical protein